MLIRFCDKCGERITKTDSRYEVEITPILYHETAKRLIEDKEHVFMELCQSCYEDVISEKEPEPEPAPTKKIITIIFEEEIEGVTKTELTEEEYETLQSGESIVIGETEDGAITIEFTGEEYIVKDAAGEELCRPTIEVKEVPVEPENPNEEPVDPEPTDPDTEPTDPTPSEPTDPDTSNDDEEIEEP